MGLLRYMSATLVFLGISGAALADSPPDWNAIAFKYMEFSSNAYPKDADGLELLKLFPNGDTCNGQSSAIPDLMIDSEYFKYLTDKARSGNKYAAEIMFRLRKLVCGDGDHSEQMDISIGTLIKPQAALFLSLIEKYKIRDLPGVLGNLGDAFVDRGPESKTELQLRYAALASVKNAPREWQDNCLAELKHQIAEYDDSGKQQ